LGILNNQNKEEEMRVLLVESGDYEEYGAMNFTGQRKYTISQIADLIESGEDVSSIEEEIQCSFSLYDFGLVDSGFIELMRNKMIDYAHAKHTDFFEC
jgi:hypothetical protein